MKVVFIVIAFTLVLLVVNISQFVVGVNSVNITSPQSNPYGLSYEDHIKNFWKYIISVPSDKNPWNDKTGDNCSAGQLGTNSSLFYLSGNGGGRSDLTCTIPAGKALFIPVSPMEISDKEAPNTSVGDLQKIAKKDQDSVTSLYLKIGDKEYKLQDLSKYRKSTGEFEVVYPNNAIFGAPAGNAKAVADGYYVITDPLPKGNYTVTFKSSLICPGTDCLQPNFAQDQNYNLIVE